MLFYHKLIEFSELTHICCKILLSQFTHFFRQYFWAKRLAPPILSLLECMTKRSWKGLRHTWYLSFFLHRHNFLDKFFSTQKRVNRDKKFSTKQRKSPKSWFYNSLMRQNTINCTHNFSKLQIFFRFLMWRAFSTWQSVTWRIFPHDNLSCGEFFHMTTCYVEKFLHIADFFSTGTARGARDKCQVCINPAQTFVR